MKRQFTNFRQIMQEVEKLEPIPVAVVEAIDREVLEAAKEATDQNLIIPLLIGSEVKIRKLMKEMNWNSDNIQIFAAETDEEAARIGADLVAKHQARAIMKGHLHTDVLLHPILTLLPHRKRLSHIFVAELESYPKLLFITDGAINITPDLKTKAAILQNAADLLHTLGNNAPKAAALSAVEVVNPDIPSTTDAACLSKMAERGQIRGAIVDGPLAFDNAISVKSAQIKGIHSPVSGDVDILLVPDLVSGNILAKDLEYLAGAILGGIVVGAEVPIILTSRADPPEARLVSTAVAAMMFHRSNIEAP